MRNWDKELEKYRDDLEKETIENEKKLENTACTRMMNNFNQSWELLKICVDYLEENESKWKKDKEMREEEKKKKGKLFRGRH